MSWLSRQSFSCPDGCACSTWLATPGAGRSRGSLPPACIRSCCWTAMCPPCDATAICSRPWSRSGDESPRTVCSEHVRQNSCGIARACVRALIELAGHALRVVYACQRRLDMHHVLGAIKQLETLVRASQHPARVLQMPALITGGDAVDRHPGIKDCRASA